MSSFIVPYNTVDVPFAAAVAYSVLCASGAVIIISSVIVQALKPAPYGKFAETKTGDDGSVEPPPCSVPQRIAHISSDLPPGFILPLVLFLSLTSAPRTPPGATLLALWLAHYVHRGLIHPLLMRYSAETTPLGIPLGGMIPNLIFASAFTLHVAYVTYAYPSYFYDPRFIIGVILFISGFVTNRWADWRLRALRADAKDERRYSVPRGGLFELICNPNYFGEFVEWVGMAIASSSLVGVLWALFGLSTFLPRALATRRWYSEKFGADDLPHGGDARWKALIPFVL